MENGKNGDAFNEHKIKKLVEDVAGKGRELLNEGLENAREILAEQSDVLKQKAAEYGFDDAAQGVKTYVQKYPLQSIGIAVAVGLVLGRILAPTREEERNPRS